MAETSHSDNDPAANDPAANDPAANDPTATPKDEPVTAQAESNQVVGSSVVTEEATEASESLSARETPADATPNKTAEQPSDQPPDETSVPGFEFPGDRAKPNAETGGGKRFRLLRSLQWLSLAVTLPFLALNGLAALQVRSLTSYSENSSDSPPLFAQPPLKRLGAFALGVKVPRPENNYSPADIGATFETHRIDLGNGEFLEGWHVQPAQPSATPAAPAESSNAEEAVPPVQTDAVTEANASIEGTPEADTDAASDAPEPESTPTASASSPQSSPAPITQQEAKKRGMVLLFPAYAASKQTLLQEIRLLRRLGYASFAVDLRGVGDSSGSDTTLGRREAADVAATVDYIARTFDNPPIALYGRLLGAGYVMRAIAEFDLQPQALILEDPPAQLFSLTQAAVESVGLPRSPTTQMLTFWGGLLQQDEPGAYDPINYANQITAPTLVLYGSEDSWVSLDEIVGVHSQLQGQKEILGLPADRLTPVSATAYGPWLERVGTFLDRNLSGEG